MTLFKQHSLSICNLPFKFFQQNPRLLSSTHTNDAYSHSNANTEPKKCEYLISKHCIHNNFQSQNSHSHPVIFIAESHKMYKQKKLIYKKIWLCHLEASTNRFLNTPNLAHIKLGCTRPKNYNSAHTFTDGTVQTTKVRGMFAKPFHFPYNSTYFSNFDHNFFGKNNNNICIGKDNHFDFNTAKIITYIKVECVSNVNSELTKPSTNLRESTTSPPSEKGFKTHIDAFRLNPGGFLAFNMASISKDLIDGGTKTNIFKGKPHLFKEETYYHSEDPFERKLIWKLPKGHDLVLIPKFDWLHSTNATYILRDGSQTISVSKPYFEYNVTLEYHEL